MKPKKGNKNKKTKISKTPDNENIEAWGDWVRDAWLSCFFRWGEGLNAEYSVNIVFAYVYVCVCQRVSDSDLCVHIFVSICIYN